MSEARFQKIVNTWIAAQDIKMDAPEYDPNNWAIQLVVRWHLRSKPEQIWRLIRSVLDRDVSDEVLMMVACGPLEDLLSSWGDDYIEQVEQLSISNAKLRSVLKAVYRRSMPSNVWERLQALAVPNTTTIDPPLP